MTFIATHTLSLRAQTLIATIARIDRLGGDILDGDTCHEPGDIPKLGVLLDEQAFDWSKERLGEGISVLAGGAEGERIEVHHLSPLARIMASATS